MINDPLKLAKDALDKAIEGEKRNKAFMASMGPAIIAALSPLFSKLNDSISKLRVDVKPIVQVNPEIKIPRIEIPTPVYNPPDVIVNYTPPKIEVSVPKIDLSSFKIPDLAWPKGEMQIGGSIRLKDIDLQHPLPVQLRDAKGNPVTLGNGGATIMSGGGGGFREVNATIVGANGSIAAAIVDSSGVGYSGSNPLPVVITSGGGSTTAAVPTNNAGLTYNSDNPLPVTVITDSITLDQTTDSIAVRQVSGFADSVNVAQFNGNPSVSGAGYQDNAIRVVQATDAVVSVNIVGENQTLEVIQVSGAVNSVNIVGNIGTLDVQQVSGSVVSTNMLQTAGNPTVVGGGYQDNALRVVNATDAVTSVNIASIAGPIGVGDASAALRVTIAGNAAESVSIIDFAGNIPAQGLNETGGGVLRVIQMTDTVTSTQAKLLARTTNPSAASDATPTFQGADKLGRALNTPIQVRDLVVTAYATFSTGTEATLLAGIAGKYLDLIYILASNNSTVSVGIDIRPSTAGSIIMHLDIPANGVVGVSLPRPIPQQATGDGTGGSWTVDLPDITGTTVSVSGLFSNEI